MHLLGPEGLADGAVGGQPGGGAATTDSRARGQGASRDTYEPLVRKKDMQLCESAKSHGYDTRAAEYCDKYGSGRRVPSQSNACRRKLRKNNPRSEKTLHTGRLCP